MASHPHLSFYESFYSGLLRKLFHVIWFDGKVHEKWKVNSMDLLTRGHSETLPIRLSRKMFYDDVTKRGCTTTLWRSQKYKRGYSPYMLGDYTDPKCIVLLSSRDRGRWPSFSRNLYVCLWFSNFSFERKNSEHFSDFNLWLTRRVTIENGIFFLSNVHVILKLTPKWL